MTSQWRRARDREPERPPALPVWPGTLSNGEFLPPPTSPRERAIARAMLDRIDLAAARTGIDRRRFLRSSGAMAASLSVLNACASGDEATPPTTTSSTTTSTTTTTTTSTTTTTTTLGDPGGEYVVPEPEDEEACEIELSGEEFIFDVHTHHVMPEGVWRENARRIESMINNLVPRGCGSSDRLECLNRTAYITNMFLGSDTTFALLSDVPNSGPLDAPVPFEAKVGTADLMDAITVAGQSRVLVHDVIAPNFGDLTERLDGMTATAETGKVAAFKVYTAWGPGNVGYSLADPTIGLRAVERARDLGVSTMCAHKGLPLQEFDRRFNGPDDICAVAALYPDMNFVVYHSAYEIQTTERAYDPDRATTGTNSLVKAMDDHGIPPNGNVWCELGTSWRETMGNPTEAAHMLGKLLTRVGEDRVMWGTDAIWLGSPQRQIEAFRAFQITEAFQTEYGYPALTDALKSKVFGLNAATLFGVDPDGVSCGIDRSLLEASRGELEVLVDDGLVPNPYEPIGFVTRRQVLNWWRQYPEPLFPA
ncbi:MAG: amidohydrolase family protein [Actinomycetota bacterium]